jgi:hypothetical protein
VLVVLGPEVEAYTALLVFRYWLEVLAIHGRAHRSYPYVQDAVHRGEEGEALPIRGEAWLGLLRVAEEDLAWYQRRNRGFRAGHLPLSRMFFG